MIKEIMKEINLHLDRLAEISCEIDTLDRLPEVTEENRLKKKDLRKEADDILWKIEELNNQRLRELTMKMYD